MKQTDQELWDHLHEQVGFILSSVQAYHDGKPAEAKRIALGIRVLVHDTRASHSVLSQLGITNRILFYDTAMSVTDPGIASAIGLVGMVLAVGPSGQRSLWTPNLDPGPDLRDCVLRPFHSWWTRSVIKDNRGQFFSRRDLVLGVADQDGGAHVDPELDEAYAQLTRNSSIGWRVGTEDGGLEEIPGLELACVRQVAHELLVSLACQAPQALPTRDDSELYASRLIETEGPSLEMHADKLRPPFGSLPKERIDAAGIGRNDICPCGSGQKFKHCHGL